MDNASHNQMVSLIWNIADDVLRDVFLRGQYRDVILPMIVLRRLDALLEPTKDAVEASIKEDGIDPDILRDITGLPYYNTSKWTLNRLKAQATDSESILLDNFNEYLRGYSDNIKDILLKFGFLAIEGKNSAGDQAGNNGYQPDYPTANDPAPQTEPTSQGNNLESLDVIEDDLPF